VRPDVGIAHGGLTQQGQLTLEGFTDQAGAVGGDAAPGKTQCELMCQSGHSTAHKTVFDITW